MKSPQCRTLLWYLVFTGMIVFILHYININIAIIAMVEQTSASFEFVAECKSDKVETDVSSSNVSHHQEISKTFKWSEVDQATVLGAPYWCFCAFLMPAGLALNKFGAKAMLGWSNLAQAFLAIVSPFAVYQSFTLFCIVRAATGAFSAFGFAVLPAIAAEWIPPTERSHFMTCYISSALAIAVGYPVFGWICETLGWEYIFYFSGFLTCLWFIAWQLMMFDSPRVHPRITEDERNYILDSLDDQQQEKLPIPWRKLFTSKQVWLICLINSSYGFIFMIFVTYAPTYFKNVYGQDIKSSAALASIPHTLRMIVALFVGRLADSIIRSEKISKTNVRKFASGICTLGAGIAFLALSFSSCNIYLATLLFGIVTVTSAFPNAGFFAAIVDLTPNFATTFFTIGQTFSGLFQVTATIAVGYITDGNQTVAQWQKVFLLTAILGIIPGLIYITFGSTDVLDLNHKQKPINSEEMLDLKSRYKPKRNRTESGVSALGSIILS